MINKVYNFQGLGPCFYTLVGKRPPRKGEYYLSGAIIEGYCASNDLSNPFWVVRPTFRAIPRPAYRHGERVDLSGKVGE